MNQSLKLLEYWRDSLVDADRMSVDIETQSGFSVRFAEAQRGQLDTRRTKTIFDNHYKDSKSDVDKSQPIPVLIYPIILNPKSQHGQALGDRKRFAPLWIPATLQLNGQLQPYQAAKPWIARDCLEPAGEQKKPVIGHVEAVDLFFTNNRPAYAAWTEYWAYCEALFAAVTKSSLQNFKLEGYQPDLTNAFIISIKGAFGAVHILKLYEAYLSSNSSPGLLPLLCSQEPQSLKPLLKEASQYEISSQHLGQMGENFSLSNSQREALYHFFSLNEGDLLAVNGPPGTGKTTLLQSVIASLWVQAAIQEAEPPVIVAASTNNQAVTNVISSFGYAGVNREGQGGRWLPDISSYGLYCKSERKQSVDKSFQAMTLNKNEFFGPLESPKYLASALPCFLEHCTAYFRENFSSVEVAQRALHKQLLQITSDIKTGTELWLQRNELIRRYQPKGGLEKYLLDSATELADYQRRLAGWEKLRLNWRETITARPLLLSLLAFLPPLQQQIHLRNQNYFSHQKVKLGNLSWDDASLEAQLAKLIAKLEQAVKRLEERLQALKKESEKLEAVHTAWKRWCNSYKIETDTKDILGDIDTKLRFQAFCLATHYWEASWLLEMQNANPSSKGPIANQERKWRRYAKLTPCFVSTLYMSPAFFSAYDGKYLPLNNFIDLLIIDEAGQVSPEIAAASFGLAKKALVVGDMKQIEPVWSITPSVDYGNLQQHGLIGSPTPEAATAFSQMGMTASSGSLMRLAQQTSFYQKFEDERGMFLSEHRRCVPEIIDYCNQLAYEGRLDPRRPSISKEKAYPLPSIGYAHIPGASESPGDSGSRRNPMEAKVMIQWLQERRESLEKHYDKALGEIVGIITPFKLQATLIEAELQKAGIDGVTVGTVHVLQGAERDVVLFSPVYHEPEARAFFFDQGPNMLNVAVSRARDSFLVFGNMNIFERRYHQENWQGLPSNFLAKYLFRYEENEITDIELPELEFEEKPLVEHIRSLQGHRQCLADAIRNARKRVCIVSPFISHHPIIQDGLADLIRKAVARGVEVVIYSDQHLNQEEDGQEKFVARKAREILRDCRATVKIVKRVHNKTICVDDSVLVEGSFNWLSASRDENYIYQRHESSIRYEGPAVDKMTSDIIQDMEARLVNAK